MSQRATLVGGDRGQGDAGPGSSLAVATLHQVAVNTPKLTHTPTDTHTHPETCTHAQTPGNGCWWLHGWPAETEVRQQLGLGPLPLPPMGSAWLGVWR